MLNQSWLCLKQVMCLSYSHFTKWKNGEWLLNWIRRETKLHVLLLACTLLQLNTLAWDISSWIWRAIRISQNRVSDPLTRRDMWPLPWQIKSVYPVHLPETDEDDDDKPLVRSDRAADSEDEDDKPLVQPSSRKELEKEKRESAAERRTPAQSLRRKGPPVWRDPTATLEQDVSGNRVRDQKKYRFWAKIQTTNYWMSETWGTFTWSINICPLLSSKKRTTDLDLPGKIYDLYQHVVMTCPFCNSTKPRPDRLRVSGLWAEEFGDLIFLDHGSTQIGGKTFGFFDYFGWSDITFDSISVSEYLSIRSHF